MFKFALLLLQAEIFLFKFKQHNFNEAAETISEVTNIVSQSFQLNRINEIRPKVILVAINGSGLITNVLIQRGN